ncbi:MAG: RNA-dependent DNA polymerase [Anaerolineae bacterium]|nr:RNA-dependent DNA polymerase [Anaerolineae bacterium]
MGELYAAICRWENLRLAYEKAARGKRGKGPAAAFEYRLADNLLALQRELVTMSYQPGPYHSFYIHDPKRRLISAAPFRDRVVHYALCNQIEPPFERSFIHDSYANRVGKGTHRALDRAQAFAGRFGYLLQCDVEQFFPAVDHEILRGILARQVRDRPALWLVDQILASGVGVLADEYRMRYFPGDTLWAGLRPRGLPIGNLTSQFWANCYLNPFDHFVKRELGCQGYLRYVDDFLLFADDKRTLLAWREALVERLARLRLTIHPGAHPRPTREGFPFLGFVVYPTHRRLKRRNVVAYRRRLRWLVAGWVAGEETQKAVVASLLGWINHARYGDTWGLRGSVVASLPPMATSRPASRQGPPGPAAAPDRPGDSPYPALEQEESCLDG